MGNDATYVPGKLELSPTIYKAEVAAITARRDAVGIGPPRSHGDSQAVPGVEDGLVGLALSGGGIRSATFSLGVMQALAAKDYLRYVDYLSTVSGGGYIGGALTWLLHSSANEEKPAAESEPAKDAGSEGAPKTTFGTGPSNLPFGVDDPRGNRPRDSKDPVMLRHLREHGKYLAPGGGITLTSLLAVILRGIVLNFLVWLPLAVALMVVVLFGSHALSLYGTGELDWRAMNQAVVGDTLKHGYLGTLMMRLAGLMAVLFVIASVVYSLASSRAEGKGWYSHRRWFESKIRWPLWAACMLVIGGSLPIVHHYLADMVEETGFASLLLGGLTLLAKLKGSGGKGGSASAALVPVASALFLYGMALSAYWMAFFYFDEAWFRWALLVAVVVALITGRRVNLNYISIHRYYRDRLMETFMPDSPPAGQVTKTGPAVGANKAKLSDMCGVGGAGTGKVDEAPYHLINTNVVLVDSDDRRLKLRGGDNFILSPLYCGSGATGWTRTTALTRTPLTLPTAVAISAAAANPNTGVGGEGATRNPLLSLVMSLLNIRLGFWVPNQDPAKRPKNARADHFRAARYEISPHGYEESRPFLQITDGGHFENLALYELIRRSVKLIICCDGGADQDFSFSDLQVFVRRVGSDFGARVDFDKDNHLEHIIPQGPDPVKVRDQDPNTPAYPEGTKFADRGYVKGEIVYPREPDREESEKSTLILIKTTMIKEIGLTLKGYKGKHPSFPDESTADQFFDEEQFEAYRELGYAIARQLVKDSDVKLGELLRGCAPPAGNSVAAPA